MKFIPRTHTMLIIIISCLMSVQNASESLELFVKKEGAANTVQISVDPDSTVINLKKVICDICKMKPSEIKLTIDGKDIDDKYDKQPISCLEIRTKAIVDVSHNNKEAAQNICNFIYFMAIFIKIFNFSTMKMILGTFCYWFMLWCYYTIRNNW